jgi:hypothetical protein
MTIADEGMHRHLAPIERIMATISFTPAEEAEFLRSPALRIRKPGYPARFNGQVPRLIRTRRTIRPDFPFLASPGCVAREANVYLAWTNSQGAVAAVIPGGNLGLKPDEFDVVEWAELSALLLPEQPARIGLRTNQRC